MSKERWKTFALAVGIHFSGVGIASGVYVYTVDRWLVSAAVFGVSAAMFVVCGMLLEERTKV